VSLARVPIRGPEDPGWVRATGTVDRHDTFGRNIG
jgi:hypothetical protein